MTVAMADKDRHGSQRMARALCALGLFALPALVVTTPANLLPFGLVLLASSLLGAGLLWRGRSLVQPAVGRPLLWMPLVVIGLGLLSLWHSGQGLRAIDNLSRLLVIPWTLLWVCALRPPMRALWSGAVVGLIGCVLLASWQVLAGAERAHGWTNAIVLADVAVVLLALVLFCRPPARKFAVAGALLATVVVMVLTGSRGAWPALAVLLLGAVLGSGWGHLRHRVLALALLGTAGLVGLALSPQLREQVRLVELSQDISRLEQGDVDSSAGARYERLQVAWQAFAEAPLTGVGVGRFDTAMTRLPVCRDPATAIARCHLDHAHNDLAEWGATGGIAGVLALLAIYGVPLVVFVGLWRRQGPAAHGPAAAGIAVVLIYMVCGLTQSMFAHQITAGLYACLVGVLSGLALTARQPRP